MGDDDGRRIRPGATVSIGQELGAEGSTGTSTGFHLHFQVEINGRPVNPVPFMADRGAPLNGTAVAPKPSDAVARLPRPSEWQARRRRGVSATRTRAAGTELAAQSAAAHPGQDQKAVCGRSRQIQDPLDLAGRHRHGRNRPWPQQPHQLRRRSRADAIHARHLRLNGCRRRRRRPRRHSQRRRQTLPSVRISLRLSSFMARSVSTASSVTIRVLVHPSGSVRVEEKPPSTAESATHRPLPHRSRRILPSAGKSSLPSNGVLGLFAQAAEILRAFHAPPTRPTLSGPVAVERSDEVDHQCSHQIPSVQARAVSTLERDGRRAKAKSRQCDQTRQRSSPVAVIGEYITLAEDVDPLLASRCAPLAGPDGQIWQVSRAIGFPNRGWLIARPTAL
jgi:hypothetical protein